MSIEENTFNREEEEAKTYNYNGVEYDNAEDLLEAMSNHRKEMIKSYENLKPLKTLEVTADEFFPKFECVGETETAE